MTKATFNFPRGFLWGTATASYQVEGNNTNSNWYSWEEAGNIIKGQRSGLACDWWNGRWREDFDLAATSGHNAHRLSIEWGRVQPTPDRWDENALDMYREMIRGLHERGMTPIVTLHHLSEPIWFTELGGWESEVAVAHFVPYVRKVVEALKEYVNLWITINEPNNLVAQSLFFGVSPPGKNNFWAAIKAIYQLVHAHAGAYHAIHDLQPTARVGASHYYQGLIPARKWSPFDILETRLLSILLNETFPHAFSEGVLRFPAWIKRIPDAKNTQDFLGLNYYTQQFVSFNLLKPQELFGRRFFHPEAELSDTGLIANEPEGLFRAIKWGCKFNLPIIITENGVENVDDNLRRRYLAQHIHQMWRGVNFNFPVKGYLHWTLVDNFEWERGWTQRFGLWELDVETQARRKRPSADFYSEICQKNGLSSEMVARYAPEIFGKLFPK